MCLPALLKAAAVHFTDMYHFQTEYYFYRNPDAVTAYCVFDTFPFQTDTFSLQNLLHRIFHKKEKFSFLVL